MSATRLDKRGFHAKSPAAQALLEKVGRTFLTGFAYAAEARTPADAERRLETVERDFRGFSYEGAAMGFTILDGLGLRRTRRVDQFLRGRGDHHVYMVHVGVGWGLARLPRWRWRNALPADPLLGWLVLDGYGFHQAYFHTDRYVREQYQEPAFPWPVDAPHPYAARVIDQGIGRALWFVEGTDVTRVAKTIGAFAPDRQADLFAGAGLAASYAGGADESELEEFWRLAGDHRPGVAQACAFAAKARLRSGLVTRNTHLATAVFCGTSPEQAAAVTDTALVDLPNDGPLPNFEVWRQRIAHEFVSLGRC